MAATLKNEQVGYTIVKNTVIANHNLTLRALGLYLFMHSKPSGWEFSYSGLTAQLREGTKSIRGAAAELTAAGLLVKRPKKQRSGEFTGWEWTINPTENAKTVMTKTDTTETVMTKTDTTETVMTKTDTTETVMTETDTTKKGMTLVIKEEVIKEEVIKEEEKREGKPSKNKKHQHGENKKVLLTTGEKENLYKKMGLETAMAIINDLDWYIASKGNSYKSHYHTILAWHRKDTKEGQDRALITKQYPNYQQQQNHTQKRHKNEYHATQEQMIEKINKLTIL